jgi:hypothetical protein
MPKKSVEGTLVLKRFEVFLYIAASLRISNQCQNWLWGRIFILDFAYILRKFASDLRLFCLKTKKYLHRHPLWIAHC